MLDAAGDKPVTFRTLDIGGDKVLPYMETVAEENPALGWRAIRLGLDRPGPAAQPDPRAAARRRRPRAEDHVPDGRDGATSSTRPRRMVERELTYLRQHGHTLPERVEVGTMVEVPSLLFQLDELLTRVDFLSVGSNDLMQFLFAVDRGNRQVADRFDPHVGAGPARAARHRATRPTRRSKPVTLCGEMASQAARRAGADRRSAIARCRCRRPRIGPVKAMMLDLDAKKAAGLLTPLLDAPSGSVSIREKLTAFAEAEGLPL